MKQTLFIGVLFFFMACQEKGKKNTRYVPDSSGNINDVTIVMPEKEWDGLLGKNVRTLLGKPYEGLPLYEPEFSWRHLNPKAFSGFMRQSRNILLFQKDSIGRFALSKDPFAKPQIIAHITGEDAEIQSHYLSENIELLRRTLAENERKEKLRRIKKSLSRETTLAEKFGIHLKYPSAYETAKDTTNFIWIEKPIQKGHLNIIAYTLPLSALNVTSIQNSLIKMRDSIGATYLPGRLPNTHMITERAYAPYFYKASLSGKTAYLTKGMWEVKNDYMAGPFVNYAVADSTANRWVVIEGFAFAPSVTKRDYMFELNTILSTLKIE